MQEMIIIMKNFCWRVKMSEEEIRNHLYDVYAGEDWDFLTNYIMKLQQENQQLKDELNILFLQHINYMDKQDFAKLCHISRPYLDKLLKNDMTRTEIYEFCLTRNKILGKVKE